VPSQREKDDAARQQRHPAKSRTLQTKMMRATGAVGVRHSFDGRHFRRDGFASVKDASQKGVAWGRPSRATGYGSRRRSRCFASLTDANRPPRLPPFQTKGALRLPAGDPSAHLRRPEGSSRRMDEPSPKRSRS
jgi:hypothetical protein